MNCTSTAFSLFLRNVSHPDVPSTCAHVSVYICARARAHRSFEEVALRFVQRKATDALRVFLMTRLERTDAKREVTQRVMLCTWLTELFLDQLNQLKDGGSGRSGGGGGGASGSGASDEYEQCVADFRAFLIQYKQYLQLNRDTTFDLIASHGRIDELLFYAQLIGEHERVIQHHLQVCGLGDPCDSVVFR